MSSDLICASAILARSYGIPISLAIGPMRPSATTYPISTTRDATIIRTARRPMEQTDRLVYVYGEQICNIIYLYARPLTTQLVVHPHPREGIVYEMYKKRDSDAHYFVMDVPTVHGPSGFTYTSWMTTIHEGDSIHP